MVMRDMAVVCLLLSGCAASDTGTSGSSSASSTTASSSSATSGSTASSSTSASATGSSSGTTTSGTASSSTGSSGSTGSRGSGSSGGSGSTGIVGVPSDGGLPSLTDLPDAGCAQLNQIATNDPRSVCFTRCVSDNLNPDGGSDGWADITQVGTATGRFTAHVHQSWPVALDLTFLNVVGSWSGHFFNFNDNGATFGDGGYLFHQLSRGIDHDGNMEVYLTDLTINDGPMYAAPLNCRLIRN